MRKGCLLFLLLNILAGAPAFARQDYIPGSRYTSARAAAMGDAFLPMGEDPASALFYNPANLAKIRKTVYEPVNFTLYMNTAYFGTVDSNFYNASSLEAYAPNNSRASGFAGVGGQFIPTIAFPWAAFGLLIQNEVAASPVGDGTFNYRSLYQIIPTAGKAWHFFNGMVRIGYSLQWVNQASGSAVSGAELGYNRGLTQGSGFSHNAGVGITVPLKLLPSFNFVFRNIGDTNFTGSSIYQFSPDSTGAPPMDPFTMDFSFSIHPSISGGSSLNLVLEARDMTNITGAPLMMHLATGFEWNSAGKFFFRAGYRGGAPSGGFGLKKPGAEMSVTFYGEQLTASSVDNRMMMQYQFRSF